MFLIRSSEWIGCNIKKFVVECPHVARKRKCGQFVIVRLHERGERIPLTIVDSDPEEGTITLIVQSVGKTTKQMNSLEAGDFLLDVAGPLGTPTEIRNFGTAVTVGGGVGNAIAYPVAVALKEAGNEVIVISGARSKEFVILESEYKRVADKLVITTDDGTYGEKGLVTDALQQLLSKRKDIGVVFAIGPIRMMKAVSEVTRPYGIKTIVSLNPIMVDGTGMCGGCRAVVGGKTVFVCVDGPEFDAHQVDFDLLELRNQAYRSFEQRALREYEKIISQRAHEDSASENAGTRCAASL